MTWDIHMCIKLELLICNSQKIDASSLIQMKVKNNETKAYGLFNIKL